MENQLFLFQSESGSRKFQILSTSERDARIMLMRFLEARPAIPKQKWHLLRVMPRLDHGIFGAD